MLGAIVAFVSYLAQMPSSELIGDILYSIDFLMVVIGWIIGGREVK